MLRTLQKFYYRTSLFFILFFILHISQAFSENSKDLQAMVDGKMKLLHEKYLAPDFDKKYGFQLVPYMEKYLQDSDRGVRLYAFNYIKQAGLKSSNQDERRQAVEMALRYSLNDTNEDGTLGSLLSFNAADFSEKGKQMLHDQFKKMPTEDLVLVIGVADMKSELDAMKAIVDEVKGPMKPLGPDRKPGHSLAFDALRARARMGVKADIQKCIELVDAIPEEDDKVLRLLNVLSYVRQPEVVNYIKKYYFMDKHEQSGGSDVIQSSYSERAEEVLSKMLRDFPKYKPDRTQMLKAPEQYSDYKRDLRERNRKWLKTQTSWDIIR